MKIPIEDSRFSLLKLLCEYQPEDSNDDAQRKRIIEFVASTPTCFERSHLAGHITGSAWLVEKTGGKVLLTHHKKLNRWLQLGGHADGNPDVAVTARREAEEESSLTKIKLLSPAIFDLDVHPIPARKEEPAHFHYDIRFAFQITGSEDFKKNAESLQLSWVDLEDLGSFTKEESLLRMARKWKRAPYGATS